MKKSTIIYYNGGENYKGNFSINSKERKEWHKNAKEQDQTGYLSGCRYYGNEKDCVICYFKKKPSFDEIQKRRKNGFLFATWYWLQ